ncbi:MAG: hypothetical protein ACI4T9_11670 [Prevotella sp.]
MKKIALAAMAALALASCSSNSDLTNDVVPSNYESTQTPVTFGTYVGKSASTRAAATGDQTTTSLQTNGFGVIAYYTGQDAWAGSNNTIAPNFMYNQKVAYNSSNVWAYDPVVYWPNTTGDKVSFFAYAPYEEDITPSTGIASSATTGITALSSNTATGEPTVKYVLGAQNAAQVDLMYAVKGPGASSTPTAFNTDLTKTTTSAKVNFLFKHALAKIGGVTIKANPDDGTSSNIGTKTFITVKEVKIEGVAASTYTTGTLNLATGAWTLGDASTADNTYYDLTSTGAGAAALNTAIAEPTTFSAENTTKYVTTTAQPVFGSAPTTSYIIPTGKDQQLKVTVVYVVRTINSNLSKGYSEVTNNITNNVTFKGGFAANKAYTLNISLGMTSVKFTASVEDWAASTSSETQTVELPALVTK